MSLGKHTFGSVGQKIVMTGVHTYRCLKLGYETFLWIFLAPLSGKKIRWGSTFVQMVYIGVNAIPIVATICFFVGIILAMQAAYQLERFGASIYVADLVAVSMTREMGPMLTAIIVAGRSGSALAAEIGTMKVSEEIDALQTMALNPIGFLVVPRVLGMMIVVPCLTLIADFVGILGGFLFGITDLNLSILQYLRETAEALVFKDLITGLIKSFFFAILIALIGCYQGFGVKGGAEGVGKSTTNSVVISIFMIIVADLIFTALFYSTL